MVDPQATAEAGRSSLKAFAWAFAGAVAAWSGILVVTGDPLGTALVPVVLGGTAVLCGLAVFRLDPRPKARWRGTATGAMLLGLLVLAVHIRLVPGG